ncbi:hypothetical protein HMPREF9622_02754 [Cutibacterium modestum HL037PA3]|uniref:Uncharacterized protein n=1 Tax=Cutibacterium modestum HL044PA1 TaxID=765109 RepID=A0ABN0C504_9ACTN|nr:hypothetical protein HMPREF9607_01649 [Cutibacterium modestum HL044PA1]EFT14265.1 hypothetical protein HMPREF9622_02754 [Cutibacterium modestum HL037PA3]EGG26483.1 hypothetical protein PA08_1636 [Cutibacterium modestum P08]
MSVQVITWRVLLPWVEGTGLPVRSIATGNGPAFAYHISA